MQGQKELVKLRAFNLRAGIRSVSCKILTPAVDYSLSREQEQETKNEVKVKTMSDDVPVPAPQVGGPPTMRTTRGAGGDEAMAPPPPG